jgi:hypothetical protein
MPAPVRQLTASYLFNPRMGLWKQMLLQSQITVLSGTGGRSRMYTLAYKSFCCSGLTSGFLQHNNCCAERVHEKI